LTAVEPESAPAHAAHAFVLARLGRAAAAEDAAARAIAIDAKLPAAHRARAEILRRRGDLSEAITELRFVVRAEPGSIDDRVTLAVTLAAAGLLDEASTAVSSLELAAPTRAEVFFVRAFIELRLDRPGSAVEAARRALALRPRYPEARMVLAEALLRRGDVEAGRREVEAFLGEAPAQMSKERALAEAFLRGPR
jgi:predicted Zn-dependent protease